MSNAVLPMQSKAEAASTALSGSGAGQAAGEDKEQDWSAEMRARTQAKAAPKRKAEEQDAMPVKPCASACTACLQGALVYMHSSTSLPLFRFHSFLLLLLFLHSMC